MAKLTDRHHSFQAVYSSALGGVISCAKDSSRLARHRLILFSDALIDALQLLQRVVNPQLYSAQPNAILVSLDREVPGIFATMCKGVHPVSASQNPT
jgi:hypothetical protein